MAMVLVSPPLMVLSSRFPCIPWWRLVGGSRRRRRLTDLGLAFSLKNLVISHHQDKSSPSPNSRIVHLY